MPYEEALNIQRDAARRRISGELDQDLLLLVEHPPVVTLGRSTKKQNLIATRESLHARGVEVFDVERGGDVTFHGPGQIVGYTIIDLKRHRMDLHWILRQIEEALIGALAAHGIAGVRNAGSTGVWTAGRKIASIGVHARNWVTWHGFALNVTTDLSYFELIVPCGIDGVEMTNLAREQELMPGGPLAARPTIQAVGQSVAKAFAEVLGLVAVAFEAKQLKLNS